MSRALLAMLLVARIAHADPAADYDAAADAYTHLDWDTAASELASFIHAYPTDLRIRSAVALWLAATKRLNGDALPAEASYMLDAIELLPAYRDAGSRAWIQAQRDQLAGGHGGWKCGNGLFFRVGLGSVLATPPREHVATLPEDPEHDGEPRRGFLDRARRALRAY